MPVNCLIFASMDFLRLPSLPPWVLFLVHVLVDLLVSGNALHALRRRLSDPTNVLQSWDPTLVNPCTWFHVTCDSDNHVIRLWDSSHSILLFFCVCIWILWFPLTWNFVGIEHVFFYDSRDLGNSNISGTLGPEIGDLQYLQYLYCSISLSFWELFIYVYISFMWALPCLISHKISLWADDLLSPL